MKKKRNNLYRYFRLWFIPTILVVFVIALSSARQEQSATTSPSNLLQLLGIEVSPESLDYVQNKTQFQLQTLLTEQRHPKTWNLSERIKTDVQAGLPMLFSVDEDIVSRLDELAASPQILSELSSEIKKTILSRKKIYVYGCGATGRLAKQIESTFWRPFWNTLRQDKIVWQKVEKKLGPDIGENLIGEMTGGDRALISSLEGFEDLQLIGRLQLKDHGVEKGDLVVCVTEGGETSSVIGTILAALDQWKEAPDYSPAESRRKLYFVYNNPDDRLRPFDRSRQVIDEPGITKINLTTGPMAITGSTRMQATTIETFVLGAALQSAVYDLLQDFLSAKELQKIGFNQKYEIQENLKVFSSLLSKIKNTVPQIARWTELEAQTYASNHFSTYFAQKALITVFIDSTERSPTFRLFPLDTVEESDRKCWIQVWTAAKDKYQAWQSFLGRSFRGLKEDFYRPEFEEKVDDPYLQKAALESLKKAGDNQQDLYDFSLAEFNIKKRGPKPGDLGVIVCLSPEENSLFERNSAFSQFINLFLQESAAVVLVRFNDLSEKKIAELEKKVWNFYQDKAGQGSKRLIQVWLNIDHDNDPFLLKQNIALKMILNAHSTAVMARLGRVVGNTMTNVSPSNLKLIGRATYLIQSHVNDCLQKPEWIKNYGLRPPITYGEANVVLFDSIAFLKEKENVAGQTAEVALSIIRILESLRQKRGVTNDQALVIVQSPGLAEYLSKATS
jgi:N-acetylmuramic acid 6-phosphate (MurNAc-6-P) etherase